MRISDWSSDVCSSDLVAFAFLDALAGQCIHQVQTDARHCTLGHFDRGTRLRTVMDTAQCGQFSIVEALHPKRNPVHACLGVAQRSEKRRVGKECVSTCTSRWSQYP